LTEFQAATAFPPECRLDILPGWTLISWNLLEESSTGAKESMPSSGNKEGQFDSEILCGLMLNLYGTRGGDTSEASRTEEKSSKIGMSK